jgi:pimeloyl-ACP methyl ester carboxylesterase
LLFCCFFDRFHGIIALGRRHRRGASLYYPALLRGDLSYRAAQNGGVVKPYRGYHRAQRRFDNICTVKQTAHACFEHNAADHLHMISAPTLVVGGEQDIALDGDASRQIAAAIPNAALYMYQNLGHGLYDEAKDFQHLVLDFLTNAVPDGMTE